MKNKYDILNRKEEHFPITKSTRPKALIIQLTSNNEYRRFPIPL